MFRYAMVNDATGVVDNVCNWDGELTTWAPPAGYTMVQLGDEHFHVGVFWTYANGVFTEPVYVEPEQPAGEPTVQGAESL
jgi:hypothetical protein